MWMEKAGKLDRTEFITEFVRYTEEHKANGISVLYHPFPTATLPEPQEKETPQEEGGVATT